MQYTVIGVWQGGEAIAVGVIEGDHQVGGGDDGFFDEGVWATHVEAPSMSEAEDIGCHDMMANQFGEDESV